MLPSELMTTVSSSWIAILATQEGSPFTAPPRNRAVGATHVFAQTNKRNLPQPGEMKGHGWSTYPPPTNIPPWGKPMVWQTLLKALVLAGGTLPSRWTSHKNGGVHQCVISVASFIVAPIPFQRVVETTNYHEFSKTMKDKGFGHLKKPCYLS